MTTRVVLDDFENRHIDFYELRDWLVANIGVINDERDIGIMFGAGWSWEEIWLEIYDDVHGLRWGVEWAFEFEQESDATVFLLRWS